MPSRDTPAPPPADRDGGPPPVGGRASGAPLRYRPCGRCRRCLSGRPRTPEAGAGDCWTEHLTRVTDAMGIRADP
jgi:hypothetical protein